MNNLVVFHRLISKQKIFTNNLPHLHFYRNSITQDAFFYMANNLHYDSFFNICACYNLRIFHISSRIEKQLFLNYI